MKYLLIFFSVSVFVFGQRSISVNPDPNYFTNTNQPSQRYNNDIGITGTRFYHSSFLPTSIDKKIEKVKFDAYSDVMVKEIGQNLLPYIDNLSILIDKKETWVALNNKWYRLLFKKGNSTYLFKPIVEYVNPANSTPEFKMKERYFVLENGIISKLKRKEVKKLGLNKLTNN